ncbi:hypothetical protein CKO42_17280 [Lamprobacter modestohalophilus]|uniref:Uncharacterized protein n=2 Tax=Lamprobacter modestohalophilus TaxID=1064514 RepID=A0A9X1B5Z8_9GAMM|nr:hypothetical protein [Lamprobacter modestohalophilus]
MTPDEAVQDFFQDKVFALSDRQTSVDHAGALSTFYTNYLLSRKRDGYLKHRVHPTSEDENPSETLAELHQKVLSQSAGQDSIDGNPLTQGLHELVEDQLGSLLSNEDAGAQATQIRDHVAQLLGVELADITREAQDFLNGQGTWSALAEESTWIRLYLRCHQCPDPADAIPLSALARKHGIRSYHNRAIKIGITVPKTQDAALDAFRASYRGQWLQTLGIPVDPEHLEEMSLALKILCLVALNSQEPC